MSDELDFAPDNIISGETSADTTLPTEPIFSAPVPPAEPPKKGGKKRTRIIALVAVALVVIIAAGAFGVPAIIKALNPKAQIAAALSNTFNHAGFGDASAIATELQKGAFRQDLFLRLGDQYPDVLGQSLGEALTIAPDQLSGTGFSLAVESDLPARKTAASLGVDLGAYHAGNLQLFLADNLLSFGSPELSNGKFYCVNTETLGADWAASPFFSQMESINPTLSFNLFDELSAKQVPLVSDATVQQVTQAATTLNAAVTVTKDGGTYTMLLPAAAAQTYLDTVIQALKADTEFQSRLPAGTNFFPHGGSTFSLSSDLLVLFTVENGMVTQMQIPLSGENGESTFTMNYTEGGAFTFTVTHLTPDGQEDTLASATVAVTADKSGKRFSIELPDLSITLDGETLALSAGLTMEPLSEFSFAPEDPTPLLPLDQNGVLSILIEALGGLETITTEMSTY